MRLGGRLSNHPQLLLIRKASKALSKLTISEGAKSSPALRPKQGTIQAAVVTALEQHGRPLRPADLCYRVELMLETDVSYDTVSSFLSVASRSDKWPIEKVDTGRYQFRKDSD